MRKPLRPWRRPRGDLHLFAGECESDFTNVATVTGTPPVGPDVTDNDTASVDVINPAIDIQKTPDRQQVVNGGTATFTIRVENTGDVALSNVVVSDPLATACNRPLPAWRCAQCRPTPARWQRDGATSRTRRR